MNLNIDSGVKKITINDDPTRVIMFNPSDIGFGDRFYKMLGEFQAKQAEFESKRGIFDNQSVDEHGIPVNVADGIAILLDFCAFMRGEIDKLFGAGTSQTVFGDYNTMDMFEQFLDGIIPFVTQVREEKMARYLNRGMSGRVME